MDRAKYFEEIKAINSPLLLLNAHLDKLIQLRANDASEPTEDYLHFAERLTKLGNAAARSRAEFITMQCQRIECHDFFEAHCESWGIPKFEEDLLTASDFKNGFLFTFRDHSTSWGEDVEARGWFFNSIEARFARHYQFWACDNGPEEMLLSASGNYKSIMWTIVKEYQDYSALASPIFNKQDLHVFYEGFDEEKGDFDNESLLKILEENPNW